MDKYFCRIGKLSLILPSLAFKKQPNKVSLCISSSWYHGPISFYFIAVAVLLFEPLLPVATFNIIVNFIVKLYNIKKYYRFRSCEYTARRIRYAASSSCTSCGQHSCVCPTLEHSVRRNRFFVYQALTSSEKTKFFFWPNTGIFFPSSS